MPTALCPTEKAPISAPGATTIPVPHSALAPASPPPPSPNFASPLCGVKPTLWAGCSHGAFKCRIRRCGGGRHGSACLTSPRVSGSSRGGTSHPSSGSRRHRGRPSSRGPEQAVVLRGDKPITLAGGRFQPLAVDHGDLAPMIRISPACWSVAATADTLARRSPSIAARNSCVRRNSSLPTRSWVISSHRLQRCAIRCRLLQAADARPG